ncbi:MAG: S8 family serine peptidase [Pseudobdellovibrionaceae bacterium]
MKKNKLFTFTYALTYTLSVLFLTNCTSSQNPGHELSKFGFMEGIYSTRPQSSGSLITTLKLKNPALLETAERTNGVLAVDKDLAQAILAEQTATIADLQKISPDIKILIRYRLVLNALTILAPPETLDKIKALPQVVMSEKSSNFARPQPLLSPEEGEAEAPVVRVGANTSVRFIGVEAAYAQNIHGEGMKVGIIDTGIDYTHHMFLGEGTKDSYTNNNPALPNPAFPNKKVVGGIDLVGTDYDSASSNFAKHIPVPDLNPLDEAGHGTHVAGTVAGIGDDINTYSGVAPAASLYAIKVFGSKGSTSDEVVIAALEYAADPTADLSFKEQMDVVNLSLGSGYGNPHTLYNTAVKNLVRGGTVVVASAGNSGDKSYITGSPAVVDDAISVASSVDNMNQNIIFPTVQFIFNNQVLNAESSEGTITKPLEEIPVLKGEVITVGLADADFAPALKDQIKGKVALVDRGHVPFSEKIQRAQDAGAIAVIMVNNTDGDPIAMGGDGQFNIPGVMITKAAGMEIKDHLAAGPVTVDFKSTAKVDKSWLIDTISDFSSRGPRSEDGMIKPEIAAPGTNIISAERGGGEKGVIMSGTSMAGPHIAGVMALLKQKYQDLNAQELKSILMGHGKVIADKNKITYPVSRQGAGRVQVADSVNAKLVTVPASLSFGITDIEKQKTLSKEILVKNISAETLTLKPEWKGSAALVFSAGNLTLAPGEEKTLTLNVKVLAAQMKNANDELDGFLSLTAESATEKGTRESLVQIPALVLARQISQINANSLLVHATSLADSAGSVAELTLQNKGLNKGTAYLFNLLGTDGRKKDSKPDLIHNRNCDMQSAGYRIIEKDGGRFLQVAVKLFERMTTWNTCEVNIQIDGNNDNQTDQEIAGVPQSSLPGLSGDNFVSLLLDGNKAREIRKQFEADLANKGEKTKEDYSNAVLDQKPMQVIDGSTLAIIEADISRLALADTGELNIKVSTTHQDAGAVEYDDYLGKEETEWQKISVNPQAQSFAQLPEAVELQGQESQTLNLQKGYGTGDLILYAPQNRSVVDVLLEDSQSQVVPVNFEP